MKDTAQNRFRQAAAALVALALVLSAFGPVGTAAAAPTVAVAQSPNSTTVAPGDTVEIETELAVTELNAPQLIASLPSGWTIESQTADGPAAFSGDAWTWLAGDADGIDATYVVTYTVAVPDDAAPGEYTVGAEGSALTPDDGSRTVDTAQTAVTVQEEQPNASPVADAGADQTVDEGASVTLDASGSSDADSDALTYAWTQTGGPSVTLSDTSAASPTFTAPDVSADTTLTFEVEVADGNGGTDTDTVTVTVEADEPDEPTNTSPVADAGADQTVDEGTSVTLDASGSSDADGDTLSYAWTQTDGPTVSLSDASAASPTFTAPDVENDATLTFQVTVADGNGGEDTETVVVTVEADEPDEPTNTSPVADAGADQTVDEGTSVTLDASGSFDADSDALTYAWTQTGGPSVTLSDDSAASPTFTAPDVENDATLTFEVEVADGNGGTDTDTVSVTVEADEPDDPTNDAAPETTVSLSPEDDLLGVDQTADFDLVVDPADGGVGAYSITVSLSDPSVGTITGVELAGEGSLSDVQVAEDGSSATIEAVLVDTNDTGAVTLGTVSVQGVAEGESELALDVTALGTEGGMPYDVTTVDGATLTVSTLVVGNSAGPAIDADGDGVYEDVNGDGAVDVLDVQTLFAARNGPTTTQNPDAFDFNGDGQFDVLDVQWLYYNEVA
ncbi:PKD domain-containing protein [Halogeometricum luteum]|uniref:PKD domain-containing protein n=1 Tax=Halogeometricum luteum TaxID=2950537 RepID=A0ABU2G494_9EURY|nr:PKD domain-containing protein [Halogeometricum sp. S3BR5-2]MDS0295604.1 PKD domain-containing protein [Halogeometricum sp. S3BR5-2]